MTAESERETLVRRATDANRSAWASYQAADYATTLVHANDALEAARASGHRSLEAEALSHQGQVYAGLGDYTRALDLHQQSVLLFRETGDQEGLARPLAGLANLYGALGDHASQQRVFTEAFEIAVSIDHQPSLSSALVGLGIAHLAGGDPQEASQYLQRGIEIASGCNFPYLEIVGSDHLARAALVQGELDTAHRLFRTALHRAQQVDNRKAEAQLHQRLGHLLIKQRRYEEATRELDKAEHLAHELGLPRLLEEVHAARSELYEALDAPASALNSFKEQVRLERARLSEDSRQRASVLAIQQRLAWAQQEAELQRAQTLAMAHLAHHDPLTGLPNRAGFTRHLSERVAHGGGGRGFTVLFLDLDGFKAVNDTLGHGAGDQLLTAVAQVFQTVLKPGDLVARMGGDEFTFCTARPANDREAGTFAETLIQALHRPFVVDDQEVFVTASVGVTRYPKHATDADTLLRQADLAMYEAKRSGKNGAQFYTAALLLAAQTRAGVEDRLRHAAERQELQLHYQPQVELPAQTVVGLEALLRWQDADGTVHAPAEFIPVAEESGLIVPIGSWVLDMACARLAHWRATGFPTLRIAVNVSPVQFLKVDYPELVRQTLLRHGLSPDALDLELTAQGLHSMELERALEQYQAVRTLGVRLILNDFGAGDSNLSWLLQLPFDAVKVNLALLGKSSGQTDVGRVLQALIGLANALEVQLIVNHVEDHAQLELVRNLGIRQVQGFALGPPVPEWGAVLP